ncbi:hypothetical protein DS909_03195 [Phaeobacter gallaeciensis]|uniref:Uncharacterized protein n=2 Tax=Roseobacteraceae TaxID=2854170 RepID=A0A366XA06_9RHOB|nr:MULTISPECIES: hypothetical protein [Roseobacteraceae]MBT3143407.1 hypothetical protein [Falsiruegeria litorea]MBT8169766.1 hypothetical protein [Falsiruegeria litorea]RBW60868.1 hypothetical protein DS909_03195 [Phaeobacter gallaeciensis]
MADTDVSLGKAEILGQLERILRSKNFSASQRNKAFLKYVVTAGLVGDADRLKEYTIATEVFGKDSSFDPRGDAVVRVEARRLRRALEHYYLTEGVEDAVSILMPKGGYRPAFSRQDTKQTENSFTRARNDAIAGEFERSKPTVFVSEFANDGLAASQNFSTGFTRQLLVGLTRFAELVVIPRESPKPNAQAPEAELCFQLAGNVTMTPAGIEIEAHLIDAKSGQYVWAQSFDLPRQPAHAQITRDDIANQVVRELAQVYGIIFSKVHEKDGTPPGALKSYESVGQFYRYWQTFDREMFERVRCDLEAALESDPGYAEANACLSLVYTNAFRFAHDVSAIVSDPRVRAMELAQTAIEWAPQSSRGFHALGLAAWFSGDMDGGLEALETGFRLNPNDTEVMASLGHHLALLADWERAIPLLEESFVRNPAQPKAYRVMLSVYHFVQRDFERAISEAKKVYAPKVVHGYLMVAVCAAKLGKVAETQSALDSLLAIDPDYRTNIGKDLAKRNLCSELQRRLGEGLECAFDLVSR